MGRKLEVQEDQRGLLPILGPLSRQRFFCHYREISIATGFFWPFIATWLAVSQQGSQARRITQPRHTQRACALGWDACVIAQRAHSTKLSDPISRHGSPCRNRVSKGGVATKCFLSQPIDQACVLDRALGTHDKPRHVPPQRCYT